MIIISKHRNRWKANIGLYFKKIYFESLGWYLQIFMRPLKENLASLIISQLNKWQKIVKNYFYILLFWFPLRSGSQTVWQASLVEHTTTLQGWPIFCWVIIFFIVTDGWKLLRWSFNFAGLLKGGHAIKCLRTTALTVSTQSTFQTCSSVISPTYVWQSSCSYFKHTGH